MTFEEIQNIFDNSAPKIFKENGLFNASFPKWLRNRPEEIDKLLKVTDHLPEDFKTSQRIYHLYKELKEVPLCRCGENPLPFFSFTEGYRAYCSAECKNHYSPLTHQQRYFEKHGVYHPMHRQEVKDKLKRTCTEKYGVDAFFKTDEFKKFMKDNPIDLAKMVESCKNTCLEKYGVPHHMQVKEIQEKAFNTNLRKYGAKHIMQTEHYASLVSNQRLTKSYEEITEGAKYHKPLFTLEEYKGNSSKEGEVYYYKWQCIICNNIFESHIANGRIPRCPVCYPPLQVGQIEHEIKDWLAEEFPNLCFTSTRRLIKNPKTQGRLEVDLYCAEKNFAIECDELSFHGELGCKRTEGGTGRGSWYHLHKTNTLAEQNIRLIHIWDVEWINKQPIVKSIIRRYLGSYSRTIYARKCEIKDVKEKEAKSFLNANHLQGYAPGRIKRGLYYNNELVSMIVIAPNRFRRNTWEIVRYVVKTDTNVPGGYSKALKAAEKELTESTVLVSYVDRRWFTGESNLKAGFVLANTRKPSYHYTKDYTSLYNRMGFQKKNLEKKLDVYDPNKTEWENMQINGWDRVWDCGTFVYEKYVSSSFKNH